MTSQHRLQRGLLGSYSEDNLRFSSVQLSQVVEIPPEQVGSEFLYRAPRIEDSWVVTTPITGRIGLYHLASSASSACSLYGIKPASDCNF